ncbi:MAG: RDD family protein [Defluviitaleaceae bacterium]|nr:RDD family protein [Defluviitaleaceae bacterium]
MAGPINFIWRIMLIIRRLLANVVDVAVFFLTLVGSMTIFMPFMERQAGNPMLAAAATFVVVVAVPLALQYPFVRVNQTIGKAFFGLRIVSTNPIRDVTPSIIFQREVFAKVMSVYLMCLPVLWGQEGGHEKATETKVISGQAVSGKPD